jgi:hypothetical protein
MKRRIEPIPFFLTLFPPYSLPASKFFAGIIIKIEKKKFLGLPKFNGKKK